MKEGNEKSRIKFYFFSLIINLLFLLIFFSSLSITTPQFLSKKIINISLKPSIKRTSLHKTTSLKEKTREKPEFKKRSEKTKKVKSKKSKKSKVKKVKSKIVHKNKGLYKKAKKIRKLFKKHIVTKKKKIIKTTKVKTAKVKKVKKKTPILNAKEEKLLKQKLAMIEREKKLREEVLKELQDLKTGNNVNALGRSNKEVEKGENKGSNSEFVPLNSIFLKLVKEKIQNNFSLPIFLKKHKDLLAVVKIKVDASGKILEMKFLKCSKFQKFNELVKTCLKISQPLPVNRKAVIIIEFKGEGISSIK